ncbi:MAG: polyketide synthase dehydratase domain-containing protein [Pirellulaceae bacterium]
MRRSQWTHNDKPPPSRSLTRLLQVLAHHVPVDLWTLHHPDGAAVGSPIFSGGAARVMAAHLETMEQMLAEQSEIMQQYLIGRGGRAKRRSPRMARRIDSDAPSKVSDGDLPHDALLQDEPPVDEWNQDQLPRPELPLTGAVISFKPGEQLTMERCLDPQFDHYATHHTVGGREVSSINPRQCGLPVMPMTFTLEMMMEAAIQLSPKLVAIRISRVQLSRWLAFYRNDPISIRIEATRIESDEADRVNVLVRVSDLGNREEPYVEKPKLAAVGTVTLATAYPDAPTADPLDLTDPEVCQTSIKTMYNNLFHGELFQGVRELKTIGRDGIESKLQVLPREDLFKPCVAQYDALASDGVNRRATRNNEREALFLGDPVLLDVSMHPNAAWHLEQADQTGRIMLPFEVKNVEFFGPRPAVGTTFQCHGRLDEQSPRHFTHGVVTIDSEGRVWNRIDGVRLWRFYLPFHEVNFHGPKNVYHLSEEIEPLTDVVGSSFGTAQFRWLDDLAQPTLLRAAAEVLLSDHEFEVFLNMRTEHEAKVRWMFGRVVAKDAVRRWWFARHGRRLFMADIETDHDRCGRPVAKPRLSDSPSDDDLPPPDAVMPHLSIAHWKKKSYAIASEHVAMGIDVVGVDEVDENVHNAALSTVEMTMLKEIMSNDKRSTAVGVAAKTAIGKATGVGVLNDWRDIELRSVDASLTITGRPTGRLREACNDGGEHDYTVHCIHVESERLIIAVATVAER